MAPHSSILAWKIPWTEEPGGLQSRGWHRVRHDWSSWACTHLLDIQIWGRIPDLLNQETVGWDPENLCFNKHSGWICDSWGCRVGHDWATELNWMNQTQSIWEALCRPYKKWWRVKLKWWQCQGGGWAWGDWNVSKMLNLEDLWSDGVWVGGYQGNGREQKQILLLSNETASSYRCP